MAAKSTKRKRSRTKKRTYLIRNSFLRISSQILLILLVLVFFFIFSIYLGLFGPVPSKGELSRVRNNSATLVQSHDGRLIGKYFLQNRMTIDQEDISPYVQQALIATEDSRFFLHKGLDFVSLGRVMVKSILLGDRSQGGGSTISQQLARNLYPRIDFGKFTLPVNKVREIFISARMERVYSKEEILTLYLNTVPFGDNVYGIEVASQRFFGKRSAVLTPPEAATIIGMLAANTAYNPRVHPEKSLQRRNTVLERMADQGFLTKAELTAYQEQPIRLNYRKLDYTNGPAPYFLEYIRPKVQHILDTIQPGGYNIYTDGLIITTTLDSTLQEYANQSVKQHLHQLQKEFEAHWSARDPWTGDSDLLWKAISSSSRYQLLRNRGMTSEEAVEEMRKKVDQVVFDWVSGEGKMQSISPIDSIKQNLRTLQTGFLAVQPDNGHIISWVGGRNFTFFKYDHVVTRRQVGSIFKPFVYTTALQSGMDPCDFLSNEIRMYPDFQDWTPENADGNHDGFYSVKGGLVHSVNTVSAAIIHETGIHPVIRQARKMGISSNIPEVPSIALGSADLTLLEMIKAYSGFANLGRVSEPLAILRIADWEGNILWEASATDQEAREAVMDYTTARVMAEMMKGVVERGTATSLRWQFGLTGEIAGKTGTTQDYADGWFIGFNPSLVAGAWVGADHPAVHFRTISLGQGAHTSLPIVARYLQKIEGDPRFRHLAMSRFPELEADLLNRLDCADYLVDDPDLSLLERIFDSLLKSDSIKIKRLTDPAQRKEQEEEKKGLFEIIKQLFKKK